MITDYLKYNNDGVLMTDAYFCTRLGEVRGVLLFYPKYLEFNAIPCPENEFLVDLFL